MQIERHVSTTGSPVDSTFSFLVSSFPPRKPGILRAELLGAAAAAGSSALGFLAAFSATGLGEGLLLGDFLAGDFFTGDFFAGDFFGAASLHAVE